MECNKHNRKRVKPLDKEVEIDEEETEEYKQNGITTTISKRLTQGCTSLMYACQQGLTKTVVEELRTKPEKVKHRDRSNKTALHYCCGQRDLVAAASVAVAAPELLESADEDGFTPLHLAVIQGNMAMVNLLLANKADVNALDNEGHSVVHWATVCGEAEALRTVLTAGADVTTPDINGGSPLHYAAQMCGANYEGKVGQASTKLALEILQILLNHPKCSVNVADKDGRQPLLWAASAGSAKAIIALVKAGARVESADKDGLTALHCAASRGHTECIDTLISLCGAPTDLIDSNGCTALHYAVTLGHADATSRLLDLEADPNRQDRKGRTPAHCGCAKGQFETVKLLKERGANLWLRNAKGDLPVHEAASSGRRELVEWLLEQRPKQVNTTSNDGRSLLHIAAGNDYADMCKMLLDFGADINSIYRNPKGVVMTPLDCALQKGYRSTAKFLQSNGGLPATKLRLSALRPYAFNDQELVKPLKHIEKEEIYDLKNFKKTTTVYTKKSDSESPDCSCTEKINKQHHSAHHVCNHHRKKFRRRTSSCGEVEDIQKEDDCDEVHRSKSNLEIRRRKSRERVYTSEEENDSCENCCKHKRRLKLRRKERSMRRSHEWIDSDIEIEEKYIRRERKRSKNEMQEQLEEIEGMVIRKKVDHEKSSRPNSVTKSRPQSAKKRYQKGSFTKPSEGVVPKSFDLTDEDEISKPEKIVTQVEVHKTDENIKEDENFQKQPDTQQIQDTQKEVVEESSKKVEKVEDTTKDVKGLSVSENLEKEDISSESKQDTNDNVVGEKKEEESIKTEKEEVQREETKPLPESQTEEKSEVKIGKTEKKEAEAIMDDKPIEEESIKTAQEAPATKQQEDKSEGKDNKQPVSFEVVQEQEQEKIQDEVQKKEFDTEPNVTKKDQAFEKRAVTETGASDILQEPNSQELKKSDEQTKSPEIDREQEGRRSFTLLPDSAEEDTKSVRKGSFTVLKSDESIDVEEALEKLDKQQEQSSFKVVPDKSRPDSDADNSTEEVYAEEYDDGDEDVPRSQWASNEGRFVHTAIENGRKRRLKKRMKSEEKQRSAWRSGSAQQQTSKDQDSGFEPSPRAIKTKIPSPRGVYTAYVPRKPIFATLDGRSCSSRVEGRKPGDKGACNMSAVTRSIQRNIRRYYMERKIFQHLLELKSLQIRSSKLNESVLVKRAVDDYHKSCIALGAETGGSLRRYPYSEYTFKNFEMFLYETLKSLQKPGSFNFQNINEVYEEAERRLSPDYKAYQRALECTTKTHRCLHAAHAYTGIPCAAYIPMMNHHTMPKLGFGPYKKTGVGSFYLPKILTNHAKSSSNKVSLELSHGKNKQLISLPSDKLDSNKRYYVTFTVKDANDGKFMQSESDIRVDNCDKK